MEHSVKVFLSQHQLCFSHHSGCPDWKRTETLWGRQAQRAPELSICLEQNDKVLEKLVHTVFNGGMDLQLPWELSQGTRLGWDLRVLQLPLQLMLCLSLPSFTFLLLLSLVQASHHPAGWNISLLLPPTQIHAGAAGSQLKEFPKCFLWWKGVPMTEDTPKWWHCHSSSPAGTKIPLGPQRHPSLPILWPYHRVLSLPGRGLPRVLVIYYCSARNSQLPTRLGNNCPCLTCGKVKWSRCAER